MSAPVVLVPGFWLGAWVWDDVAERLRDAGHEVLAITLPGLASVDDERAGITMADHVDAIVAAVESFEAPVVLAVHSGAAVSGVGAIGRVPERIATAVYIDTFPILGPIDDTLDGPEWAMPSWEFLEDDGNSLTGLTDSAKDELRARAVPEPGGAVREAVEAGSSARAAVPSVVVCTSFSSAEVAGMLAGDVPWLAELRGLESVEYVDLPTSHWPMVSAPGRLADELDRVASRA